MKRIIMYIVIILMAIVLTSCRKSEVVKYNIQKDADYFNVYRKITFVNLRSDRILYQGEGYFSIDDTGVEELGVTFRIAKNEYKLIYLSKHENVAYVIEQCENTHTDPYFYEFKWYLPLPTIETDSEYDK